MSLPALALAWCQSPSFLHLTMRQVATLGLIAEIGPIRPSRLCERLGIATNHSTRTLDTLETHGLISRRSDRFDARATHVRITAKGRNLIGDMK